MKLGVKYRAAAALLGLLAWGALTFVSFALLYRIGLALAAALCFWFYVMAGRKEKESEEHHHLIRMLNHHRHDWMNELQVLFGYVRLKKYDNLPDYMDKIKTKALHDSYLSKLGNAPLIVYLLDRRIEGGSCHVEVELEKEIDLRQLRMEAGAVYKLIRGIADRMTTYARTVPGEPHELSIGFDEDDGELLVDFVYQGDADWEGLRSDIRAFLGKHQGKLEVREEEYGEEQAVVALALPFRT
jgi:stage 0 sporulation protein B (sporulation initiation phosphotransferase)